MTVKTGNIVSPGRLPEPNMRIYACHVVDAAGGIVVDDVDQKTGVRSVQGRSAPSLPPSACAPHHSS